MAAVLELRESRIVAGMEGDLEPQVLIETDLLFPARSGFLGPQQLLTLGTSIHIAIRKCLDKLLVSATKTHVVVVEPPLFALPLKKLVAAAILGELRCLSLSFTSWAACWCVQHTLKEGIVDTRFAGVRYVVPVYDLRELSHLTKSDSEVDALEALRVVLPIDLRHLKVHQAEGSVWLGAAIAASNTEFERVCRSQYLKHRTVQDALFE